MKLRIRGDNVRLRLKRSEVDRIAAGISIGAGRRGVVGGALLIAQLCEPLVYHSAHGCPRLRVAYVDDKTGP